VGVIVAAVFVEGRPQREADVQPLGSDAVAPLEEAA
jgi:hypothetical protein